MSLHYEEIMDTNKLLDRRIDVWIDDGFDVEVIFISLSST
jgi:hypothetical protein